ncbi:WD40 repeat domain-containing protein [Micromonospora sp. DT81.3]|uniref:WD40 repeat domain-containing protein n=1 Tax=Micromonospora sp. DT81.3 TaxID=3416523 RepID=UPI003CF4EC1F
MSLADGRIATGGYDGRVRVWAPHHPGPVELGTAIAPGLPNRSVGAVTALPDARIPTGGRDNRVLIWDSHHPGTPLELGTHDDWVGSVIALPDGRIATGGDCKVRIWNPHRHGTPVIERNERSTSLAVSGVNQDYLVVANGITLWRITSSRSAA